MGPFCGVRDLTTSTAVGRLYDFLEICLVSLASLAAQFRHCGLPTLLTHGLPKHCVRGSTGTADTPGVLNDTAQGLLEDLRGQHPTHVFTWEDPKGRRRRFCGLNNPGRKAARRRAAAAIRRKWGDPHLRVSGQFEFTTSSTRGDDRSGRQEQCSSQRGYRPSACLKLRRHGRAKPVQQDCPRQTMTVHWQLGRYCYHTATRRSF